MDTVEEAFEAFEELSELTDTQPRHSLDPHFVDYHKDRQRAAAQKGQPISSFDSYIPRPPGPHIPYGKPIPGRKDREYPKRTELAQHDKGYEKKHPEEKALAKDAVGRRAVYGQHYGMPLEGPMNWKSYFPNWESMPRSVYEPIHPNQPLPEAEVEWTRAHGIEFVRKIASGGFGTVWLCQCYNADLKGRFACKVLNLMGYRPVSGPNLHTAVENMLRESDEFGNLIHPNVVRFEHVFRIHDQVTGFPHVRVLIFMELCDGDLGTMVQKAPGGRLEESQARDVMQQTCVGLKFLHDQNIVHFGIKPWNILYLHDKERNIVVYKLTDFGESRRFAMGSSMISTRPEWSPEYMDPALDRPGSSDGKKADIYSLGSTLAFMFVGNQMEKCRHELQMPSGGHTSESQDFNPEMSQIGNKWGIPAAAALLISKMTLDDWKARPTIEEVIADPWMETDSSPMFQRAFDIDKFMAEAE